MWLVTAVLQWTVSEWPRWYARGCWAFTYNCFLKVAVHPHIFFLKELSLGLLSNIALHNILPKERPRNIIYGVNNSWVTWLWRAIWLLNGPTPYQPCPYRIKNFCMSCQCLCMWFELELKEMDYVCDTCKYHLNLSVTIFKVKPIQADEVKERLNWKFRIRVAWYLLFGRFFCHESENDPEHIWNGPNQTKFENREVQKFHGIKKVIFHLQNTRTQPHISPVFFHI